MGRLFREGEKAAVDGKGNDHTYGSRHYVDLEKQNGSIAGLKAIILIDMIGDRAPRIKRDTNSTAWLTDVVWDAARRQKLEAFFVADSTRVEDDHLPFLQAGVPSVDIIDLERFAQFNRWHTAQDNLDAVSARSLQIVGDVVLAALSHIEARLSK